METTLSDNEDERSVDSEVYDDLSDDGEVEM